MKDIDSSSDFQLQLVVTGGHLIHEQGHTIDMIIEDGFYITEIVDAELNTESKKEIAKSMGKMAQGFAEVFGKLNPDYVAVLGDRYELLPICSTAFVMGIPIIHISGGDITEGAIDDGIRNAVTMLAEYHFPGTAESAENIIRMRGSKKNVWTVGEPGLDSFVREKLFDRDYLADNLGLDIQQQWILMTYHAETKESFEYNLNVVKMCIDEVIQLENYQTLITYANADYGGKEINEYVENMAKNFPHKLKVIPALGHLRYLSFMKQVCFVIGNSSAGIVEAPFMNVRVINIGDRQKGRYQCANICQCDAKAEQIARAVKWAMENSKTTTYDCFYWGDGHTSERILSILHMI